MNLSPVEKKKKSKLVFKKEWEVLQDNPTKHTVSMVNYDYLKLKDFIDSSLTSPLCMDSLEKFEKRYTFDKKSPTEELVCSLKASWKSQNVLPLKNKFSGNIESMFPEFNSDKTVSSLFNTGNLLTGNLSPEKKTDNTFKYAKGISSLFSTGNLLTENRSPEKNTDKAFKTCKMNAAIIQRRLSVIQETPGFDQDIEEENKSQNGDLLEENKIFVEEEEDEATNEDNNENIFEEKDNNYANVKGNVQALNLWEDLDEKKSIQSEPKNTADCIPQFDWNEKKFLLMTKDTSSIQFFLSLFTVMDEENKMLIIDMTSQLCNTLLSYPNGKILFLSIYTYLSNLSKADEFLIKCDFKSFAFAGGYSNLIEVFNFVKTNNPKEMEVIYSMFNDQKLLDEMIKHKQGKFLIEYFLKNFLKEFPSNDDVLIRLLKQNFISYSQTNYSTFVIQVYIETYKPTWVIDTIDKNFEEMLSTRNSIFVISSAVESFKSQDFFDILIAKSEILCTNQYASTMLENIFLKYPDYTVDNFLEWKHQNIPCKSILLYK